MTNIFKKKSQSSIEFITLVVFILFFFTIFFIAIQSNISSTSKSREGIIVKEIALTVQDEINLAYESSNGYFRKFTLPEKISNQDYTLMIVEESVYVKTSDNKNAIALPVISVVGNISKGENYIRKENGTVYLN